MVYDISGSIAGRVRPAGLDMRILVCIKQVLDPETILRIDESGRLILPDASPRRQMNSFDEYAIEAAVRVKEEFPSTLLDVISIGPQRVKTGLERALGMGANRAVHIDTGLEDEPDPRTAAAWLAEYAGSRDYDLILTGVMAEDDQEGVVGPLLAEYLDRPLLTAVVSVRIRPDGLALEADREVEGGRRETWELSLPAVITIQSGRHQPRYPTLSGLLRAKKQTPETVAAENLSRPTQRLETLGLRHPELTRAGLVLEGTPREKAAALLKIWREKAYL